MTNRIARVNSLIQKSLSEIILKEIEFSENILVTLTDVETSVDLTSVKVYISVLPEEKSENVLGILNKSVYDIQNLLNKRLKMRPVPKIKFLEEKKIREGARIEELLEKIKNEEYK